MGGRSVISTQFTVRVHLKSTGLGSNGVTVTKFLQLLTILELYLDLELSSLSSRTSIMVTVTEVTKVLKLLNVIVSSFSKVTSPTLKIMLEAFLGLGSGIFSKIQEAVVVSGS